MLNYFLNSKWLVDLKKIDFYYKYKYWCNSVSHAVKLYFIIKKNIHILLSSQLLTFSNIYSLIYTNQDWLKNRTNSSQLFNLIVSAIKFESFQLNNLRNIRLISEENFPPNQITLKSIAPYFLFTTFMNR